MSKIVSYVFFLRSPLILVLLNFGLFNWKLHIQILR
jgi:hypothetical protein